VGGANCFAMLRRGTGHRPSRCPEQGKGNRYRNSQVGLDSEAGRKKTGPRVSVSRNVNLSEGVWAASASLRIPRQGSRGEPRLIAGSEEEGAITDAGEFAHGSIQDCVRAIST